MAEVYHAKENNVSRKDIVQWRNGFLSFRFSTG